MKTSFKLSALSFVFLVHSASGQAPYYPGSGSPVATTAPLPMPSAPYTGMSPTLPAPAAGSPYAGPTMVDPNTGTDYGDYQEYEPDNRSGGTLAQSMGGGTPLLNYSYVDAGYRFVDPKVEGANGSHGLGVALVMDLPTVFFLKGSFSWGSGSGERSVKNAANADYKLATITIGGGAYIALTNKFHLVGEVGLVYASFQADGVNKSYTDGGIYIRPSMRYQVLDWMELQAGVTISSASEYDSKVIDFGGYFRVLPQVDFNIGADFGDATRTFKTGARLRW